ncbi:MAG TPA: hypothetical protein VF099_03360 [Ktedonobacterales bacterium]
MRSAGVSPAIACRLGCWLRSAGSSSGAAFSRRDGGATHAAFLLSASQTTLQDS